MDAVILAVAHKEYESLTMDELDAMYKADAKVKVLTDIKGMLNRKEYEDAGYLYWRL